MDASLTPLDELTRAFVALLGAAALGWQRERHGKPAGLRTQMLVGLGAATSIMATMKLYALDQLAADPSGLDPLRVIQGVVGGIGFLGAGTIIQSRGSVRGITTAATVWVTGAYGVACGLGFYSLAGISVVLALLTLSGMGMLERRIVAESVAAGTRAKKTELLDEF